VKKVIRWLSLPLAAVAIAAPLASLHSVYDHYAGKVLELAEVLESRVARARSRGSGATYDLYVRYRWAGRPVENNVRVTSFRSIHRRDHVRLLIDPRTGDAEDDLRSESWIMVGWGALAATFFVIVGFVAMGRALRRKK